MKGSQNPEDANLKSLKDWDFMPTVSKDAKATPSTLGVT